MGAVSHNLMHVTDWFPTLLHLAGCQNRDYGGKPLDGKSQVRSIFSGRFNSLRTEILHELDPLEVSSINDTRVGLEQNVKASFTCPLL